MQKVRILIVEDELLIAEAVKSLLENMGYEVPAIFTSGKETLENFKPGFADIIIMDIFLAENTNGIDTCAEIRKISNAPVIFITDNKDEQLRKKAIFQSNTVQYISKPFNRLDISIAIDLAIKTIKHNDLVQTQENSQAYLTEECIFLRQVQGHKKIRLSDILYLEASGNDCFIWYKSNNKMYLMPVPEMIKYNESLSAMETKLSFCKDLQRVHRSFIVNIKNIETILEGALIIAETEIPIGRKYKDDFRQQFRFI